MSKAATRIAVFGFLLVGMIACEAYLTFRPSSDSPPTGGETAPSGASPSPEGTAHSSAEVSSRRSPVPAPPAASAPAIPARVAPAQASREEDAKLREQNIVTFQSVHGLAIAYGDIVLGRVPDGFAGTRGYTEIPPVQLWDPPVVPYVISHDLPNPQRVQAAIDYFNKNTPVSFVPYQGERDAVVFQIGDENCVSSLGKQGGLQAIRLANGCRTQEILHEMLHALGFVHEQSRPDRDGYVEIAWDNIDPKEWPQFEEVPDALMARPLQDTPFDFQSIMLYRPDAFALHPGSPTIKSKTSDPIAPVSSGLSPEDLQKLLKIYRPEDVPHL